MCLPSEFHALIVSVSLHAINFMEEHDILTYVMHLRSGHKLHGL